MHQLKLSVIIAEFFCTIQTFALQTRVKINNSRIKDACCLQPSACDLTTTSRLNAHTRVQARTLNKTLQSSARLSCIPDSAAVLMQAGLGTLIDQEFSFHYDTHIINFSKYMNYSQLQICTSSMSLSLHM